MGDVEERAVLSGYVGASIAKGLWLRSSLELGSGNTREGAVLKLGASYAVPINASLGLNLSAGATFANANHMGSYFGVNAAQSAASGYATYAPSAGLRDVGIGIGLIYKITPKWGLGIGVNATALSNTTMDSPLVRRPRYATAMLGVVYGF
ncbi:MAG: MipA/OmpV family protein [Rhodoferax sp.]|nr:MipA/OmpV family protein [Rhodoferax sp.]